jgi:NTP pyrophosphatase (non-canonical NTP hydrolase)
MNLSTLQAEVSVWGKRNFPKAKTYHPLLGVQEEAGELAHAHLKAEQGIRGTPEEHHEAKCDAIADILIFLAHYCELNKIDMEGEVTKTWHQVRSRDWVKFPTNGKDK